jgi:hypothetical protein
MQRGSGATQPTARGDEEDDERYDNPERDEKPDSKHGGETLRLRRDPRRPRDARERVGRGSRRA